MTAACHVAGDGAKTFCPEFARVLEGNRRTGLLLCRTVHAGEVLWTSGPFYRERAGTVGFVVRFCPFCGGDVASKVPEPAAPAAPDPHNPRPLP